MPIAVDLLNQRPLKRNGNVAPGSINSMFDDFKVREARKKHNVEVPKELNFHQQNKLQENYEKSKNNFQVDDFVYLDYKEDTFAKSFNLKISIFFLKDIQNQTRSLNKMFERSSISFSSFQYNINYNTKNIEKLD